MKINLLILLNAFVSFFTSNLHIRNTKLKYINDDDLFNIDKEMDNLNDQMKKLKKHKNKILSNISGLKVLNDTEIDNLNFNTTNTEEEPFTYPTIGGLGILLRRNSQNKKIDKSENFEIMQNNTMNFTNIGGYDLIKSELMQCADLLINYTKYDEFNVRVPKGLILEGPPGNGKTLLVKCFAGEINVGFIPVSGSQFQEKYVGVGASRIRELFELAEKNSPCIIFIDEIDAVGRKRSTDDINPNSERDSTLNELLVALDGFKSSNGVFVIGATNRLDLLDPALIRPGRIDKSIYIGLPDAKTRYSIINIHKIRKPIDSSITMDELIDMTQGLSGAQIENLLNEAMLFALRNNKNYISKFDLEFILNRILVGWQSSENIYSHQLLYQISIHEMGHAIVGMLSDYKKLVKVSLNLWSPSTPGYTLFENKEEDLKMHTKQSLITHLMVLLGGRIAEEIFFNDNISTGASKDLDDAKKIAENMILKFGMGKKLIHSINSDVNKQNIDDEIMDLINIAYFQARIIISNSKSLIDECALLLMNEQILTYDTIIKKIKLKYSYLLK